MHKKKIWKILYCLVMAAVLTVAYVYWIFPKGSTNHQTITKKIPETKEEKQSTVEQEKEPTAQEKKQATIKLAPKAPNEELPGKLPIETAEDCLKRGDTHYKENLYYAALIDYNKAIEIDPNKSITYYVRGKFYCQIEKYDMALADYSKMIEIDPDRSLGYYVRGLLYYQIKRYDEALADYDKVIQIDPFSPMIYFNRGKIFYFQKKYQQALEDFNKAVELGASGSSIKKYIVMCEKRINE